MNLYEHKISNIRKKTLEKMENLDVEKLLKLSKETSETLLFSYDSDASIISNVFFSIILNKKSKTITVIDATNHESTESFDLLSAHEVYNKILIKAKRIKEESEQPRTKEPQKVTIGPDLIAIKFISKIDLEMLATTEFLNLMQTINNANLAIYNILLESQSPTVSFRNSL